MKNVSLSRFAYLSVFAALVTISLKSLAYFLTGSIGLLSDALESIVNLIAAIIAVFTLQLAQKPPDADHVYGHTKAEYFSSIIEGILIFGASISIGFAAINRLMHPQSIEQPILGLALAAVASGVNLVIGKQLLKLGKKHHSITLEADAYHLFTDVWTSAGVILGLILVSVTHLYILDPLIAIVIAINIVFTGFKLIKRSALGFMDTVISSEDINKIYQILDGYTNKEIKYHGLLTRQSGTRKFMSVHILTPGNWSIKKGHDLLEEIEKKINKEIKNINVLIHLEPIEDPKSLKDIPISRSF